MKAILCSLIIAATLISSSVTASNTPVALPRSNERLAQPISTSCGLKIVEWRGTSSLPYTVKTEEGVKVIEQACKLAVAKYPDFLKSKKLSFSQESFSVEMALMPANSLLEGKLPRNLNDTAGRFQVVQPNCCSWGIYDAPTSFLFLRNDPVETDSVTTNKYFVRTLLHELAHVMNDKWHVRERNFPGNLDRDEEIAEEWVSYLGIKYRTESSYEDLSFKGLR